MELAKEKNERQLAELRTSLNSEMTELRNEARAAREHAAAKKAQAKTLQKQLAKVMSAFEQLQQQQHPNRLRPPQRKMDTRSHPATHQQLKPKATSQLPQPHSNSNSNPNSTNSQSAAVHTPNNRATSTARRNDPNSASPNDNAANTSTNSQLDTSGELSVASDDQETDNERSQTTESSPTATAYAPNAEQKRGFISTSSARKKSTTAQPNTGRATTKSMRATEEAELR